MSVIDLRRRIERIEAECHTGAPTRVMADYPITDEEAEVDLVNWRGCVAKGEASIRNGVLYLLTPEMTADEWAERHVTAH